MIPDFLTQAFAPERWPTFALITARLGGLMMVAPLWSMGELPRAVRAAITVVLAVLLLPLAPTTPMPQHILDVPLPMVLELIVGIVIGMTASVLISGVTLGGEVIAMQMGLSIASTLAPMPDLQVSSIAQLKGFLALLIYVSIGGHIMLLHAVAESLTTLPPGSAMDLHSGVHAASALFSTVFSCAACAAAPVMVTLLLSNVGLALLSRAVPQLNTMMVSLPVSFGIGLVMFGVSLPIVASAITGWMRALPASAGAVLTPFAPVH